jgi:hypothetical protein
MKIFEIATPKKRMLAEAKARIDHPEDILFDEGLEGAQRALDAIKHASTNATSTSVKWDGTPAIIFGRDENGFVFTDKAGFGAKKYDGMARSATMFRDMIYNRKPDEPGRLDYAGHLAKLYPMLEKAVPKDFKGYIQGDVMWMNRPPVDEEGNYVIKPLKIRYRIPKESALGEQIGLSDAGVVVHSMFDSRDELEPRAIDSVKSLGLTPPRKLVILSPEMNVQQGTVYPLSIKLTSAVESLIAKKGASIKKFLDPYTMGSMKISNLGEVFKSYLNFKAGHGDSDLSNAPQGFIDWVQSEASKLTANKQQNIIAHISENQNGYKAVWQLVSALVNLKMELKSQLDVHPGSDVRADIRGEPGHEGFVSDTPHGKIKLVNRPVFMKKA